MCAFALLARGRPQTVRTLLQGRASASAKNIAWHCTNHGLRSSLIHSAVTRKMENSISPYSAGGNYEAPCFFGTRFSCRVCVMTKKKKGKDEAKRNSFHFYSSLGNFCYTALPDAAVVLWLEVALITPYRPEARR